MLLRRKSMVSGIIHERDIQLNPMDFAKYEAGMLIQRAMPYLSEDDREFIISGITPEEWDSLYPPEEE